MGNWKSEIEGPGICWRLLRQEEEGPDGAAEVGRALAFTPLPTRLLSLG